MRALITGVTGQDGYYLAELLLAKGYEVHGLVRWTSQPHAVPAGVVTHTGDLSEYSSLAAVVSNVQPDEVYNLAALSDLRASALLPDLTSVVTGSAATWLMTLAPAARFFQASSAQMFTGNPYAAAKLRAHTYAGILRDHGQYVVTGVMHNHESPRRSPNFLIRRVTRAVAAIVSGEEDRLELINLGSRRDWGWAPEYVEAMWLSLQQDAPDEYEIGTGELHSVEDVCRVAFDYVGLDWRKYVTGDPGGDSTEAADTNHAWMALGWTAATPFETMVERILESDLA